MSTEKRSAENGSAGNGSAERVMVFLRTSLFSVAGPTAHVPHGVTVVVGTVIDRPAGSVRVAAERLVDERGRVTSEAPLVLELPWDKIDHIAVVTA